MAVYGPQLATRTGLAATYNAADAGLTERVPPGVLLHIKNTNAATRDLGIVTRDIVDGDLVVTNASVTIPATTGERFVRVPTSDFFRDPSDGLVGLTWTANTGVTFAVIT